MNCIFFTKKCKKERQHEESRAEERQNDEKRENGREEKKREFVRLMCVSLFSFEECRYTTNNK